MYNNSYFIIHLMLDYNFLEITLESRGKKDPNILIMELEMPHNTLFSSLVQVVAHCFIIK